MTDEKIMAELKTIKEATKLGTIEASKKAIMGAFTNDWYFCGWERWMVMACFLWTVWSVCHWIWSVI